MISFKQFLLERSYKLSFQEAEEVDKIVNRYLKFFNPSILKKLIIFKAKPEDYYKNKINEQGNFFLGSIQYYDDYEKREKKIPIEVSFIRNEKDRGRYEAKTLKDGTLINEVIYLYYYKLKFYYDDIEDVLVHELYHAKQPYKTPGKEYRKSKRGYYTDPVEVHTYTSLIIDAIEDAYANNTPEENQKFLKYLKIFAREGRVPKDLEAPKFLEQKNEFIKTLYANRNNPKYKKEYQRFINKILWIVDKLEQE